MRDYRFADGSAVRAIFAEDAPLEGRDMLLIGRFVGLDFRLGVRVGEVTDEVREESAGPSGCGAGTTTLHGHLERGQMDYQVWKWLDTARSSSASRPSRARRASNRSFRIGFGLLGRREQLKFYRHTCTKMAALTAQRTGRAARRRARVEA